MRQPNDDVIPEVFVAKRHLQTAIVFSPEGDMAREVMMEMRGPLANWNLDDAAWEAAIWGTMAKKATREAVHEWPMGTASPLYNDFAGSHMPHMMSSGSHDRLHPSIPARPVGNSEGCGNDRIRISSHREPAHHNTECVRHSPPPAVHLWPAIDRRSDAGPFGWLSSAVDFPDTHSAGTWCIAEGSPAPLSTIRLPPSRNAMGTRLGTQMSTPILDGPTRAATPTFCLLPMSTTEFQSLASARDYSHLLMPVVAHHPPPLAPPALAIPLLFPYRDLLPKFPTDELTARDLISAA